MTKIQLFLISLVGAIPGGFLAYQLVMVFLNHGGGPSTTYQGLLGLTLVCSSLLALLPILVLALYSSGFESPKAPKDSKQAKQKADDEEAEDHSSDDDEVAADADEFDDDDMGDLEEMDADDLGDDFEEEDDTPKNKKRR